MKPTLLLALAPLLSATAAHAEDVSPAAELARDLNRARAAGGHLRDLTITQRDDAHEVEVGLVVAGPRGATRYLLSAATDQDGGFTAYRRAPVSAVAPRIYASDDELFTRLAAGAPTGLEEECGTYVLSFAAGSVVLDEQGYKVIAARATGRAARRLLHDGLVRGLAGGTLISAEDDEGDGPAAVSFEFDQGLIVRAERDAHGALAAVEVDEVPRAYTGNTLRDATPLDDALAAGPAVVAVKASDDGGVVLGFGHGVHVKVAPGDFDHDPDADGCSC